MSSFVSIIIAVLIFSFLIFVHELGHFITAKLSGVQVNEFAMFMGPAIFKKKIGETTYSLRCIPIGGYCAMEGEDQDTENPRSFLKAAWWKRLIILIAGSSMNLIAGFLIVLCVNCFIWRPVSVEVSEILAQSSLAENGGIQAGDTILKIGDLEIKTDADMKTALDPNGEAKKADVLVIRDGQELLLKDVTFERRDFTSESGEVQKGLYGISYTWIVEPELRGSFNGIFAKTWDDCVYYAKAIWESLGMLVTGKVGLQDMSGPLGIVATMSGIATKSASFLSGFIQLLSFGGFIAINLGVMNMLPIPALDGGRVLALLITTPIKAITKKPINPKIEAYIHAGGMILLLIFMGVIMFKDIFAIFMG